MRVIIALLTIMILSGCASATSYSYGSRCHDPKLPKAGQDMTSYAEYLLRHIKKQCN